MYSCRPAKIARVTRCYDERHESEFGSSEVYFTSPSLKMNGTIHEVHRVKDRSHTLTTIHNISKTRTTTVGCLVMRLDKSRSKGERGKKGYVIKTRNRNITPPSRRRVDSRGGKKGEATNISMKWGYIHKGVGSGCVQRKRPGVLMTRPDFEVRGGARSTSGGSSRSGVKRLPSLEVEGTS